MTELALDRRYCRDVLPRVSRTFAVNIRLLPGAFREAVGTAYLLCRIADTLEDAWPGAPEEIERRFVALERGVAGDDDAVAALADEAAARPGDGAERDLVRNLPRVLRVHRALDAGDRGPIEDAVREMARGMSRYAARAAQRGAGLPYVDDEAELEDYCWVVAGCVGVMLSRLQARREEAAAGPAERRLALAPVVGRALQLTNILLDWPLDVRRGRCFVPAAWLAEFDLSPDRLVGSPHPGIAALATRLETLARRDLARVPDYLDLVPTSARRYRHFVLVPAIWALRSIERARRDPGFPWSAERPKLSRAELWSIGAAALSGNAALDALRGAATAAGSGIPGRA